MKYYVYVYTANGLRLLLKDANITITHHRAKRNPLLTEEDIGKTPREIGYYYR